MTDEGLSALGDDFEQLPTGKELIEYWLRKLPTGEASVFQFVITKYPDLSTREEISDATNYKRSSRDTYIQRLSQRKLIIAGKGGVKPSDFLFE